MPSRPQLSALTGIRFFAAFWVVVFHYAPRMPGIPGYLAKSGFLAVGLFFVLSGFVLAYNYADRPLDKRHYLIGRFARIYPAYLLAFVFIAPAVAARFQTDPEKLARSGLAAAALVQGWIARQALAWNAPGWSLSCEAFFYLLFPVVLPVFARLSRRGLWFAAVSSCLAAAVPHIAAVRFGEATLHFPAFRLPEFLLGIVSGLMYLRAGSGRRLPHLTLVSFAAVGVVAALPPDWLPRPTRGAILAPLFAAFVVALAAGQRTSRFLSASPLRHLGNASYAIYILQSPVMAYFRFATQGIAASNSRTPLGWAEFGVYCSILIAASLACYSWIEVPARQWLVSVLNPRSPHQPALAMAGRTQ